MEWRPISEAPKDGTKVDLWGVRTNRDGTMPVPQRFTNAQWTEDRLPGTGDPTGTFSWKHDRKDIYGGFVYTHFRPLPPPPTGEDG